ncbi:hypothetical protein FA09DRAFT_327488 [Tilletiopsis washingtonensis]|uniref:Vps72/YL1 C-terminal domain-containing protein n=1 Tax=Tilletiopsis washingtonensis TaxID=58919 RepID=A0A316ZG86_9BASI|nr:hypothetical protein FA09DRAFT_327488 [Tilletiopsis washingtonensis]PWO00761.1 hypothetical protein FA09DRAFT_327488 [Tilletiopsis washingtonensis]
MAPTSTGRPVGRPASTPSEVLPAVNISAAPRPFKTSSSTRKARNRSLKQILATERDMQLNGGIAAKRERQRKARAAANAAASAASTAPTGAGSGKPKLAGAAAARQRMRQERIEREERARIAEEEGGDVSMADGDTSTAEPSGAVSEEPEELTEEERAAAEAARKAEEAEQEEIRARRALPNYFNVEAPPSLRPRKKMCDVTGLIAPYTDPKSGLRYHSVEIYKLIKTFGPGVDQQYLSLRGDASAIQ